MQLLGRAGIGECVIFLYSLILLSLAVRLQDCCNREKFRNAIRVPKHYHDSCENIMILLSNRQRLAGRPLAKADERFSWSCSNLLLSFHGTLAKVTLKEATLAELRSNAWR